MSIRRLLFSSLILGGILIVPLSAGATQLDANREDFSSGLPAVTADNTTTCNNASTVRFDFSAGVPAETIDATATCNTVAPTGSGEGYIILFQ